MQAYLKLTVDVLNNGELKEDRTKVGTLNVFEGECGLTSKGFPL